MYARKSLDISLIISLAIIVLGGCHAPSKPEIEWSNQWGNSSGNILEDGYVAANGNTVCYTSLNEVADALYTAMLCRVVIVEFTSTVMSPLRLLKYSAETSSVQPNMSCVSALPTSSAQRLLG